MSALFFRIAPRRAAAGRVERSNDPQVFHIARIGVTYKTACNSCHRSGARCRCYIRPRQLFHISPGTMEQLSNVRYYVEHLARRGAILTNCSNILTALFVIVAPRRAGRAGSLETGRAVIYNRGRAPRKRRRPPYSRPWIPWIPRCAVSTSTLRPETRRKRANRRHAANKKRPPAGTGGRLAPFPDARQGRPSCNDAGNYSNTPPNTPPALRGRCVAWPSGRRSRLPAPIVVSLSR